MARQVNLVLVLAVMVVAALTICAANADENVDAGFHGGEGTSRFLMAGSGGRGVARNLNFCTRPCKDILPGAKNPQCCHNLIWGCYDLNNSTVNCGLCGHPCTFGYSCCTGVCTNIWGSDDNNCGECGKKCTGGEHCRFGICGYGHGY